MDILNRENFLVDTLIPIIQTAATIAATQVLGRLGHYVVSLQTAAVISATAALVASFASNFFTKAYAYYATLPVGIAAGLAVHKFLYSNASIQGIIDPKGAVIVFAILASVKLIADNLYRFKKVEVAASLAVNDNALEIDAKVEKKDKAAVAAAVKA